MCSLTWCECSVSEYGGYTIQVVLKEEGVATCVAYLWTPVAIIVSLTERNTRKVCVCVRGGGKGKTRREKDDTNFSEVSNHACTHSSLPYTGPITSYLTVHAV